MFSQVERDGGDEEANLDEEMEKVFSETALDEKFDLATVGRSELSPHSRKFSENDYSCKYLFLFDYITKIHARLGTRWSMCPLKHNSHLYY